MSIVSEYGDGHRRLEQSVKLVLYVEVRSILLTGVIVADCFSTAFPVRCPKIFFCGSKYDKNAFSANQGAYSH
jgi:hypothetical protein